MNNVLVTNFMGVEDVMIFNTRHSAKIISKALTQRKQDFDEVYEVSNSDVKFYIFDPLYADTEFDDNIDQLLTT